MTNHTTTRFVRALIITAFLAFLTACQTVTPPQPTPDPDPTPTPNPDPLVMYLDGYSYTDFIPRPTMTLHNVHNPTSSPFVNRVIVVRCLELGVYTYFTSAPTTIMPGQTTNVLVPYSSGYDTMVDSGAVCSGIVRSVAGQPDWRIVQNPNVSTANPTNLGTLQPW